MSFQDHSSRNNIQSPPYVNQAPDMMDFAKYLARRELVTTGLNKFDDQPESFRAWQSSFFNATQGLELTASEELDLLIKWLGKESSDHVKRIRAVYVSNPQAALQLSWTRLQECYATPEVIESALFKRLDCFPRLSSRENSKLRELSDLLLELLSAQTDGYLPGLSYLDTPRGINPIVEKLPQNLQDKWLSTGSRYKEHHRVCYPPFSFFVEFVRCEAKARNDPSFILPNNSYSHHRNERAAGRQESVRTAISVHKTDVAATANAHLTYRAEREVRDPSKNCPLHDKPHPLERCRGFRMKPLTERKRLLKEYRRCFRCCSAVHMAKECPVKLKCNECESEEHCTTMHPDTTLSPAAFPVAEPHTEQQRSFPSEVTSRCTEVCGDGLPARSCAKICLVQVFPRGERERAVKMYAIIDDQSNRSLARSEFFQLFGIHGSPAPYLLRTCAGTTEMAGRKAVGFQIEAVDGPVCLDLPPLIECNEIMSNRSEIPTAEVALSHTHLRPVAPHIPELDPEAQILILLGRDLIRVHKVRQQINGPNNAPFAQRLDLGWVIVGEVCIDSARKPTVAVFKTNVLHNGRPSYLTPCQNHIHVKDKASYGGEQRHDLSSHSLVNVRPEDKLGLDVFMRTANDNKHALSFEDETFLNAMHTEFKRDEQNSWIAPLPLRRTLNKIQEKRTIAKSSTILNLDPVMYDGLLRIGGRLKHASVEPEVRNPIILPKCNVTKLMVSHHHTKVQHQGRHFTEGAVRAAGLGVVAGKRLIGSVIHHCVTCRKLRGKLKVPKMADLPPERLSSSPPFTYVGLDVFGPWNVVTWRTATRDLQPGDVVLLKESQSPRNEWPMGLVTAAFPSSDGKVRKVEIKTASQDKVKTFFRPITEVVLLLPKKGQRSSEDC